MSQDPCVDKNIEIAIVGGGLSGFAVAIMLKNFGFDHVTVYERDTSIMQRRQGYGLTILQGITAIKALSPDCFDRVKSLDTPSRSHYIFDNLGNIINFFGTIFWSGTEKVVKPAKANKKYNLHIGRTNLRNIIYDEFLKVSNDSVKWNHKVVDMNEMEDKRINIKFNNDESVKVDLVVGCDGINSIARRFKYEKINDFPLNYLGMILILGITHCDHPLAQSRVFQTVDGCTRLFAMPYASEDPNQNFMWQLSFPLDEVEAKRLSSDVKLLKSQILERCGDWHEPVASMINNTDLSLIMGIPAYDREPELPKKALFENIVLLGDAAHPMSPFKGQGANQGLIDAVSFAKSLKKSPNISKAISEYELEMKNRVKPKVMLSRERVTSFHDANILNSDSFEYRGASQDLIRNLKMKGINSQSGEDLESLIMEEMKKLKLI